MLAHVPKTFSVIAIRVILKKIAKKSIVSNTQRWGKIQHRFSICQEECQKTFVEKDSEGENVWVLLSDGGW